MTRNPLRITEKAFMAQVRKAALLTGWRYYHTFNSWHSVPGFPDCVLVNVKKCRLMFVEVKSETGKVTAEQEDWLRDLSSVDGVECYVLRPKDFDWFWEELKK